MKKLVFSVLISAGAILGLVSCNNGDYSATPDGGNVNPLNPPGGLDYSYNWSGTDPMSLELNGNPWKADYAVMMEMPFNDKAYMVSGMNYSSGDTTSCTIMFQKNVQAGNLIYIFYGNTDQTASFTTKLSDPNQMYESTLTNVGEVKILENDDTHVKGQFFFLAKSPVTKQYVNIQKGYFNVKKP